MNNIKNKIITGIAWQGMERVGSYGIGFVVSVVLARLLTPEEFGVIAIMMVFITLSQVFIDSGFSTALIQKKDIDDSDCSSVFYINIITAVILYVLLYVFAPLIAQFYKNDHLDIYLRVFSLLLIIRSLSLVQQSLLRRRMLFHLSFRITWVALIISGIVGIAMAYSGYGVWSLIFQQLSMALITVIMQWFLVKWRPKKLFSFEKTKQLFHFGWKLLCSSFIDSIYNEFYTIVFGKIADLKTLSFYDRGKQYPQLTMNIITSSIGTVLLSAFSINQNNPQVLVKMTKQSIRNSMFLVTPALALLFVFADSLVSAILTDKWLPCVIFIRLCCLINFFKPINIINLQVIISCGRSDMYLKLEILKKTQALLVFLVSYRFGVIAMVSASAAMGIVYMFENGWYTKKLINYPPWEQLWNIMPTLLTTLFASIISYLVSISVDSIWLKIFLGGFVFVIIYLFSSYMIHSVPEDIILLLKRFRKSI